MACNILQIKRMNVRRPCRGFSSSFFSIPGLRAAPQHSTPGYCSDGAYRRDMVRKRIIAAFCKKYAALAETRRSQAPFGRAIQINRQLS
jgi:hypothetical protein